MKKRWKWIVPASVLALVLLVFGIAALARQQTRMELSGEEPAYLLCYSRGLGPRKLDYPENKSYLDSFFTLLSGEYSYVRTWSDRGRDSGGLAVVSLYDSAGDVIDTIRYADGMLAVPTWIDGVYYLYRPEGKEVSFADFEAYLDLYGEEG